MLRDWVQPGLTDIGQIADVLALNQILAVGRTGEVGWRVGWRLGLFGRSRVVLDADEPAFRGCSQSDHPGRQGRYEAQAKRAGGGACSSAQRRAVAIRL